MDRNESEMKSICYQTIYASTKDHNETFQVIQIGFKAMNSCVIFFDKWNGTLILDSADDTSHSNRKGKGYNLCANVCEVRTEKDFFVVNE